MLIGGRKASSQQTGILEKLTLCWVSDTEETQTVRVGTACFSASITGLKRCVTGESTPETRAIGRIEDPRASAGEAFDVHGGRMRPAKIDLGI